MNNPYPNGLKTYCYIININLKKEIKEIRLLVFFYFLLLLSNTYIYLS